MPSASVTAFIVEAVPIVLQWPGEGAESVARRRNSSSSISPAPSLRRLRQITVPEPTSSPSCQPSSIGPPDRMMAGMSTVAGGHDPGRRGLVAAGGEHDGVDRIAVEDLDQAEIEEVAVERGGRAPAILEDRVDREFHRDAAGVADPGADPLGELEMDAVARREVGSRSGRCR